MKYVVNHQKNENRANQLEQDQHPLQFFLTAFEEALQTGGPILLPHINQEGHLSGFELKAVQCKKRK